MGEIDVWDTYYEELKVTNSDLKPYLTELDGHKIGDAYVLKPEYIQCQLVMIDISGYIVLVTTDGKGITSTIETLKGLTKLPYESEPSVPGALEPVKHFDWLTWRASDSDRTYKHGPLSNFWTEPDGFSLEHRFAALKTTDLEVKYDILSQKRPGKAKKMGRSVVLRPDWDEIKLDLMWDLLLKKFISDDFAREYLLATGDLIIREKNDWNDRVWGVTHNDIGQNLLGKGLMYVRGVLNG